MNPIESIHKRLNEIENPEKILDPLIPQMNWEHIQTALKIVQFTKNFSQETPHIIIRPGEDNTIIVNTGKLMAIDVDKKIAKVQIKQFKNTVISLSLDYVFDLHTIRLLCILCIEIEKWALPREQSTT